MKTYLKNCTDFTGKDVILLCDMIDEAREVKYETFMRGIGGVEAFKTCPRLAQGYAWGQEEGLRLKDDYAVSFYRSKFCGKPCYYLDHSRIEWIFV